MTGSKLGGWGVSLRFSRNGGLMNNSEQQYQIESSKSLGTPGIGYVTYVTSGTWEVWVLGDMLQWCITRYLQGPISERKKKTTRKGLPGISALILSLLHYNPISIDRHVCTHEYVYMCICVLLLHVPITPCLEITRFYLHTYSDHRLYIKVTGYLQICKLCLAQTAPY